ncbi:MAG: LptE family protein [Candidatus Poribacteria bacterium]|nr:LptE family protein [Candidatus Poribacteria bacterium]MDE0506976.1 LptE family protein [Candidatus Poribacteria bacterium]
MYAKFLNRCSPILMCLVLGCGYVSTSSYLEHIKTVQIAPVQIEDSDIVYDVQSDRPYDEILQEKLTKRFTRKWRDGNDALLEVRILDYDLREVDFGATNQAEKLRMSLQVDYRFLDRVNNKIIDQDDSYFQVLDFFVVSGRDEEPKSVQQARTEIFDEFVDDLFQQLAEQW